MHAQLVETCRLSNINKQALNKLGKAFVQYKAEQKLQAEMLKAIASQLALPELQDNSSETTTEADGSDREFDESMFKSVGYGHLIGDGDSLSA